MKRRVVITGIGAITPVGSGRDSFWNAIKEGKNGVDYIKNINVDDIPVKVAGEVKDFNPSDYFDKKEAKRLDRYTQFGLVAAKMAAEDSKLNMESLEPDRVGVIVGSGIGGIQTLEEQAEILFTKGPGRVSPFFIPMMIANMLAGKIAIHFGAKGINETVVTACASGSNAIGDAFKVIQRGDADVMFTGGAEAAITRLSFAGFSNMKALSDTNNPEEASRPFDANRNGFVMGEGAGILIIEELEHAKKRGAPIYAEIVGYGATDDAFDIVQPAPQGEGGARAMAMAVEDAGIRPEEVDYINAHGTSTSFNDKYETQAIKTVFGEHAYKLAVSSTKSMTGHLLGAAGGIEAIVCAMTLKEGILPPTIHYSTPDPECDLDYVPNVARKKDIRYALSNSFGFGGHNASILFKKYEE